MKNSKSNSKKTGTSAKKSNTKAPAKKKLQKDYIREGFRKKMDRDKIAGILAKATGKTESWAKRRIGVYERAYGEMGKNDKNL